MALNAPNKVVVKPPLPDVEKVEEFKFPPREKPLAVEPLVDDTRLPPGKEKLVLKSSKYITDMTNYK